jgi:hypothetical protein
LRHMPSQQLASLSTAKDQDFELFWLRHELPPNTALIVMRLTLTQLAPVGSLDVSARPAPGRDPVAGFKVSRMPKTGTSKNQRTIADTSSVSAIRTE